MRGLVTRQLPAEQIQDAAVELAKIAAAAQAALSGKKQHWIAIGAGGYDSTTSAAWDRYYSTSLEVEFDPAQFENVTRVFLAAAIGGWDGSPTFSVELYDVTNAAHIGDATSIIETTGTGWRTCSGDLRDDTNWPVAAAELYVNFKTTSGTMKIDGVWIVVEVDD